MTRKLSGRVEWDNQNPASDNNERMGNGVRVRRDGRGDPWAKEHRQFLGRNYHMNDIDCMFGCLSFGMNTGDKIFAEYALDSYHNRFKAIRKFALVGMFDRKTSISAAIPKDNMPSTALYLWLCRTVAEAQPIAPKFFYVIGTESPPWLMIEIDIYTGEEIGERVQLASPDWVSVWNRLGLKETREELSTWLSSNV